MTIQIRRSSGTPVILGEEARAEEAPASRKGDSRRKSSSAAPSLPFPPASQTSDRPARGAQQSLDSGEVAAKSRKTKPKTERQPKPAADPVMQKTKGKAPGAKSKSKAPEKPAKREKPEKAKAQPRSKAKAAVRSKGAGAETGNGSRPPKKGKSSKPSNVRELPFDSEKSAPVPVEIASDRVDDEVAAPPKPAPKRRATAESMAQRQRDISVSEFFIKNRHLLGFDSPARALLTTVKEASDNSLDAAEEAGILPNVHVELVELAEDRFRVIVEDNGPGIVKAQVPKVFGKLLYGSKFHRLRQSRGQQGIGISAAGMYGQLTTGKPIVITSKTGKGRPAHHFEIVIDTTRNAPDVNRDEQIEWDRDHGTRVEIELQGTYKAGRRSVDEYLEQLAIANPHAEITYKPPRDRELVRYARATQELPREPLEIKPHPYGVELGMLQRILQDTESSTINSTLQNEFSRVSPKISEEILKLAGVAPRTKPRDLKPADIERLHAAIPKVKIFAPPTACVVPIGEELIRKGLEREIRADFYTSSTRPPAVYRGNPFQVEAGLAYGGELRGGSDDEEATVHQTGKEVDAQQGPITLLRMANRVPLQYQQSACAVFKSVVDTNWRSYGLSQPKGSLPQGPMVLLVHIASVWVPFTSESKEAVAHYPEILKEMQLALQECGRKLGSFLRKREAERHEQRRRSIFEMYIGELVEALGKLTQADRKKLQQDLLALARKHTGDEDAEVEAMLKPTKRVAKRHDELSEEEME